MLLPAALAAMTALVTGPTGQSSTVQSNDNRVAAGAMIDDRMVVALDIVRGDWFPNGADRAGASVLTFAERGNTPTSPGPLIRVRRGTAVSVSIHNTTADTIAVHGLTPKMGRSMLDSVMVMPGATVETTFAADVEGSYFYWGARAGTSHLEREFDDALLNGAFVVDPAAGPIAEDRIIVIEAYTDGKTPDGDANVWQEMLVLNGRPWPHNERMTYSVGDSVHWRVINASFASHPMHLHGFYFRIDAHGDWRRDTVYQIPDRRMAVTQKLEPGQTMRIAWSPDRPGGWLFHCHLSFHAMMNTPLGNEWVDVPTQIQSTFFGGRNDDPDHHVEKHMGGLLMVVNVTGERAPTPPPLHTIRLLVKTDGDTNLFNRRFGYARDDGTEASRAAPPGAAPLLVLQRGEPTAITVVNTTDEATSVHWHGIELEAYSDGVVGVGGHADMPTPPIMPGDSFVARITPPRSGSFMYHTHVSDVPQQGKGLAGAIVIVDDRAAFDPNLDRTFLFQTSFGPDGFWLRGEGEPGPDTVMVGERYRLRLMNITLGNPGTEFRYVSDEGGTSWTTLAKDGYDLPEWQRHELPAVRAVSIGETMDVSWTPEDADESGWLEVRSGFGSLFKRQRIVVIDPDADEVLEPNESAPEN